MDLMVLPQEDLDSLMAAGAGVAPDIIYARRVPADPFPQIGSFYRKGCSLILFEISLLMQGPLLPQEAQEKNRQMQPLGDHAPTILGEGRPRMHPHRPRRHNPQRHRDRHRDRVSLSPPLHRRHEETKGTQDAGDKQDLPPTRHAHGESTTS